MERQPDHPQFLNGKANGETSLPDYALANTFPLATSVTPIGGALGTKIVKTVVQDEDPAISPNRMPRRKLTFEWEAPSLRAYSSSALPKKPAGQIKLFQSVVDDWGFSELEAATLLGFEKSSDIRDVLSGRRAIGQRDANDRLRSVLRIAADLSALYRDVAIIRAFMVQPQPRLGGATAKQLLTEGSMENLLLVKYYLAQLSGR